MWTSNFQVLILGNSYFILRYYEKMRCLQISLRICVVNYSELTSFAWNLVDSKLRVTNKCSRDSCSSLPPALFAYLDITCYLNWNFGAIIQGWNYRCVCQECLLLNHPYTWHIHHYVIRLLFSSISVHNFARITS